VTLGLQDVRELALPLPRTYERLVRDRVKFKVGSYVYLSVAPDETTMGFAYPKLERAALIASDPDRWLPPVRSDERYNWMGVRLAALDRDELREVVQEAWRLVVPKFLAREVLGPL
jgi:hypothetical protein